MSNSALNNGANRAESHLSVSETAIPAELKHLPHWVCWHYQERNGKRTKPPIDAKSNGKLLSAKTNDPATWSDFDTARATAERLKLNGVGLALSADDGLTGLDLDHVFDPETGELDPLAMEVLERFRGTYTEVSPSGEGLRIWCYGKPARSGKCEGAVKWLEVYAHPSNRYLTVTGNRYSAATAVTEQQAALNWLHSRFMVKQKEASTERETTLSPPVETALDLDDTALLNKARAARNGAAFDALYRGDTSAHGGNASAADLALCNSLAWWTNRNEAQMDRLFRQSGLMRQKWDVKHGEKTYGQMTMEKAISDCLEGFGGRKANAGAEPAAGDIPDGFPEVDDASPLPDAKPKFRRFESLLMRNDQNRVLKNITNAILICENLFPGLIGYNTFRQRIEARISTPWRKSPGAWTDYDSAELADAMSRRYFPEFGSEKLTAAIMVVAHRNPFNPAQDRLRAFSEQWDGVERLKTWLVDYMNADPVRAIYLSEIGEKWLIGVAARVLYPGCKRDDVLVLQGSQGYRKSTAAASIANAICPESFTDSLGDLGSKDAKSGIRGKVIAEFAELAALNKSDTETIKSFVSTLSDTFRPAYGRLEIESPRTVSFIATTNPDTFLKDPTGNRRWWPVVVRSEIDIDALNAALPQLLGEAARKALDGKPWHVTQQTALQQADDIRAEHYEEDAWTTAVLSVADSREITISEVMTKIGLRIEQQTHAATMRVSSILRVNGFQSKRKRVGRVFHRVWFCSSVAGYKKERPDTRIACETAGVPTYPAEPHHLEETIKKPGYDNATSTAGDHNTTVFSGCFKKEAGTPGTPGTHRETAGEHVSSMAGTQDGYTSHPGYTGRTFPIFTAKESRSERFLNRFHWLVDTGKTPQAAIEQTRKEVRL